MSINVKTQGAGGGDIYQAFKRFGKAAEEATQNALNEFAIRVQADAKRNITDAPAVDTGRLRSSIAIEIYEGGAARQIGTEVAYGGSIEFGSRPHFPPLAPIREWCRRHGLPESAAYPIALKIARNGLPAKPYLIPALEQNRADFEKVIRDAWRLIERELE